MIRNLLSALALFDMALGVSLALAQTPQPAPDLIDYNRDIRPILSNHCYACHGPDQAKRQAGLRLDKQEMALAALESGGHAIVPGNSDQSKLIARIIVDRRRRSHAPHRGRQAAQARPKSKPCASGSTRAPSGKATGRI